MDSDIIASFKEFSKGEGRITVLTGAGISAESGIPTFRGPEGYWTVGSKEYHPQEMATYRMFEQNPEAVWQWYLYRLGVCYSAEPNAGHFAVSGMEERFGNRFTLITQNVDGLHLRAGNSLERTLQIHGNVFFTRCAGDCTGEVQPITETLHARTKTDPLTKSDCELLTCPDCGGWLRPHVLWFDETYNEKHFRFVSSIETARQTDLLFIVGTSGATNLPNQVAWEVKNQGGSIVDVNVEENPFTRLALSSRGGHFIKGQSARVLPEIMKIFDD